MLGALANTFLIIVLTLYFLSSLEKTKTALYSLAPASRRERVRKLGDRVIESVGGYVAGAFVVALCAGVSSLIFLFVVGMGEYAVALAFVVALLDVIPMIGATIGAVIVSAIGFATDWKIGVACVIFYLIYQQLENYVLYPRVMSRSVDIPGAVTVIAIDSSDAGDMREVRRESDGIAFGEIVEGLLQPVRHRREPPLESRCIPRNRATFPRNSC